MWILALLIPIVPFVIIGELPGEKWLSARDDQALIFALTGAGLLAGDILLPVPSSLVGTLMAARLGVISGFLWILSGLTTACIFGYLLGLLWPERISAKLPQKPTMVLLFISRPVPVLAEAVSLVAGANRVEFLPYMLSCVSGNTLYALVLALNGAVYLPKGWLGPGLIVPMALPAILWLIWKRNDQRADVTQDKTQ